MLRSMATLPTIPEMRPAEVDTLVGFGMVPMERGLEVSGGWVRRGPANLTDPVAQDRPLVSYSTLPGPRLLARRKKDRPPGRGHVPVEEPRPMRKPSKTNRPGHRG